MCSFNYCSTHVKKVNCLSQTMVDCILATFGASPLTAIQPDVCCISDDVLRRLMDYYKLCIARGMLLELQWRHNHGVSNHRRHNGLLNRLFRRRSKKTSQLRITGLCGRNLTGEFPSQRASNAENVSMWWHHLWTAGPTISLHEWNALDGTLVNSPHKGHWRGALMFSLNCAWTNG